MVASGDEEEEQQEELIASTRLHRGIIAIVEEAMYVREGMCAVLPFSTPHAYKQTIGERRGDDLYANTDLRISVHPYIYLYVSTYIYIYMSSVDLLLAGVLVVM